MSSFLAVGRQYQAQRPTFLSVSVVLVQACPELVEGRESMVFRSKHAALARASAVRSERRWINLGDAYIRIAYLLTRPNNFDKLGRNLAMRFRRCYRDFLHGWSRPVPPSCI